MGHLALGDVVKSRILTAIAFLIAGLAFGLLHGCAFSPSDSMATPDAGALGVDGDATADGTSSTAPDATPDAPTQITLRQTTTDTPSSGHSDQCLAAGGTHAETYARVFPLAQPFHVSRIDFAANANAAETVTVRVGAYNGSVPAPTLDDSGIIWITAVATVPTGETMASAAIDADMIAGIPLIVEIQAPDYTDGSRFLVNGAAGSETAPSYWEAADCMTPQLAQHDGRNNADVGTFIINAIGYQP